MKLSFDSAKRDVTLRERGLDFAQATAIFDGRVFTLVDGRADYGEERFLTYGLLDERLVVIVWTQRGDTRHIISMRKCNGREQPVTEPAWTDPDDAPEWSDADWKRAEVSVAGVVVREASGVYTVSTRAQPPEAKGTGKARA